MQIDLFPGFSEQFFHVNGNRLFARVGGPDDAPPLLLIHGFPQSHLEWHPVALDLATTHRVVVIDLKGYGRSAAPAGDAAHLVYSKATWAAEAAEIMRQLGHQRFTVVGHDRGAQVAYKLALDFPERIERLGIMDNLPVFVVWEMIKAVPGSLDHWTWMAEPYPTPEQRMTAEYIEEMCRPYSGSGTLDCFHPAALEQFRLDWSDQAHVHAYCEDFRAGAGPDLETDLADMAAGKRITCPTLILWSRLVFGASPKTPLDIWRETFAPEAFGNGVDHGHFIVEENPTAALEGIRQLLSVDDRFREQPLSMAAQ
ncbi:alpha/beta fold hydrolase [Sphingomonas faeni]|jgi:haloacetate dehalogenase|uniref:alpha/beta fold hydrolase n=1 Tax=Sphingomonas faeni TaxID=185950 RepID=UPI00336333C1